MFQSGRYVLDRLAHWATLVYISIVLLLLLTAADQFLSLISGLTIWGKLAIYAGPLGLCSIWFGVLLWDAMRTGGVEIVRLYRHVGYIVVPFVLMSMLALAFQLHPTAYWGQLEPNPPSRLVPYWPLLYLLVFLFSVSLAAIPFVVRYYRVIFVLSLVVLAGTVVAELFSLVEFSAYGGRAAGLAGNPNIAAQILIALCIASVNWKKSTRLNSVIWFVTAIAVFLTLSRGGLLEYVFALGAYVAVVIRRDRAKSLLKIAVFVVIFSSIIVLGRAEIASFVESNKLLLSENAQGRIGEVTALLRGDVATALEDPTGRDRADLAYEAIDLIARSPVVGHGTGFTSTMPGGIGPHNIYLNQWVNNGVLGLVLLLLFLFCSLWHFKRLKDARGMTFVAAFSIAGFFSHNLLQQSPFLVLFGFLGALAYVEQFSPSAWRRSLLPRAFSYSSSHKR